MHIGDGKENKRETVTVGLGQQCDGTAEGEQHLLEHFIESFNQIRAVAYPKRKEFSMSQVSGNVSDHQATESAFNKLLNTERLRSNPTLNELCKFSCWNHK